MNKIAHRGNMAGEKPSQENTRPYIMKAALSHYVEVDVWFEDGTFWLGHDGPENKIDAAFLENERLFCHAKNVAALHKMLSLGIHCFWHEKDTVTLTSRGFVWKYPEVYLDGTLWGVCSDWL